MNRNVVMILCLAASAILTACTGKPPMDTVKQAVISQRATDSSDAFKLSDIKIITTETESATVRGIKVTGVRYSLTAAFTATKDCTVNKPLAEGGTYYSVPYCLTPGRNPARDISSDNQNMKAGTVFNLVTLSMSCITTSQDSRWECKIN